MNALVSAMELPIIIRFRWTADELYLAQRYHYRHLTRPVVRWGLHGIAALSLTGGLLVLAGGRQPQPMLVAFLIFVATFWLALIILPWVQRWIARSQMKRRPDKNLETEWQVGAETIHVSSELSKSELSWRAMSKIVRTPVGLLIYPNDQIFFWLPRSGFLSEADFEDMVELAKSKISKYYLVK